MDYFGSLLNGMFSLVFVIFTLSVIGYLIGAIEIKGVSLGTAGILLAALLYGIFVNHVPSFSVGGTEIILFSPDLKAKFSLISSLGTALFVTSVGLIAGPKFFRSFNKTTICYVYMGAIAILTAVIATVLILLSDKNLTPSMAAGIMTGALTSTPGLSAAKEVAGDTSDLVTAGYGIAYLFGILGVVLFVQIMPKLLKVRAEEEMKKYKTAPDSVAPAARAYKKISPMGFLPYFLTIALGCAIGAIRIPGIHFSLGNSGGCLVAGLLIGHFGHLGPMDLQVEKSTLRFFRELGLVLFLIGAGVPGGVNFISNIRLSYFLYGAVITMVPMLACYAAGKYLFRLNIFDNLGSITGGMTSTPALGALIHTAKTDEVAGAYAATYPVALVFITVAAKLLILLG